MKSAKRLAALVLAVLLIGALMAACTSNGNNATTSPTATPAGDATPTPDANSTPDNSANAEMYIPVVAKGFQHQFWQVVKKGAEQAAIDLGVKINFVGPEGESAIATQVDMLKSELAKKPTAICLAALDTKSVLEQLQTAAQQNIPIIGFDSGVPEAPAGQVAANASTNNEAAAAIGAEKMYTAIKDKIAAGKVTVCVLSQDATSASITGRTKGFAEKFKALVEADGKKAAIVGDYSAINAGEETSADVLVKIVVGATSDITDMTNAANSMISTPNLAGVFCSNEGAVNGYLAAMNAGAKAPEGLQVIGFDAGSNQKGAVKNGQFLGSITQDPFQIGYKAVDLAVKAAKGEAVTDVDTGAKWYDATNMEEPDIAQLLYD